MFLKGRRAERLKSEYETYKKRYDIMFPDDPLTEGQSSYYFGLHREGKSCPDPAFQKSAKSYFGPGYERRKGGHAGDSSRVTNEYILDDFEPVDKPKIGKFYSPAGLDLKSEYAKYKKRHNDACPDAPLTEGQFFRFFKEFVEDIYGFDPTSEWDAKRYVSGQSMSTVSPEDMADYIHNPGGPEDEPRWARVLTGTAVVFFHTLVYGTMGAAFCGWVGYMSTRTVRGGVIGAIIGGTLTTLGGLFMTSGERSGSTSSSSSSSSYPTLPEPDEKISFPAEPFDYMNHPVTRRELNDAMYGGSYIPDSYGLYDRNPVARESDIKRLKDEVGKLREDLEREREKNQGGQNGQ